MTQTESGEVTYTSYHNSHRWSDAANKCEQNDHGGGFLAKIKNLDELKKAREAFIQGHPAHYWVGVEYDESLNDFVWADGTRVASNVNFEAIVNRNDQEGIEDYSKRCMYISNEDALVADDCEAHRKYLCQVGESDDVIITSK